MNIVSSSNILVMPTPSDMHPSDDEWELYSLGRVSVARAAELEQHLLVCTDCQKRVALTDEYVAAMRQALTETSQEASSKVKSRDHRVGFFSWLLGVPKPAWAVAAAAVAVLALVLPIQRMAAPPFGVQLQTFRGQSTALSTTAPAGRDLILNLDTTTLPQFPRYKVEIVDFAGGSVYEGSAAPAGNSLRVVLDRRLDAGQYWVRIYEPAVDPKGRGELLGELSLRTK